MEWRQMVSVFRKAEKSFRRIMGYREVWTLEAILRDSQHEPRWRNDTNQAAVASSKQFARHHLADNQEQE
jgi:hypothetical protein